MTPRSAHDCRHCGYPLSAEAIAAGTTLCAQCAEWSDNNMGIITSLPLSAQRVTRPFTKARRVSR